MIRTKFVILSLLTLVLFIANIFFGAIHIPADVVWNIITNQVHDHDAIRFIVLESRLPQAITALLAGAGLAVTGLMLQTAFRNPLAGPSILGISSGASLGVAIVMLFFGGSLSIGALAWSGHFAVVTGALCGSFATLAILIILSSRIKSQLMLLITGIMVGYLTSSVVTLLSSLSASSEVHSFVMWGMGTFSGISLQKLPLFAGISIAALALSLSLAKPLNILLLGDNYAQNLGLNIRSVRNMLLLSTGILTAIITAYCGPIAFVGLAIPHVARLIFRTDNHWILIPATMLSGAIVTLACNCISVMPQNTIIPINALTPIVGVPVILYVILQKK